MKSVSEIYSYTAHLMGSPVVLKMFVHDETLVKQVFHHIRQLEDRLTVNRAQSEVMSVNHAAGQHDVTVSLLVFSLIKQAKAASQISDSCFNLAIGPVVKLWKIGFNGCAVPDAEEIARALALTNPEHVMLNEADSAVFLAQAGMEIDLGAIAKGYIADRIRNLLYQHGVYHAVINLGGNVLAIGRSLTQGPWSVGLQRPFAERDDLLGVIRMMNKSVVTSGVYERFFTIDDQVYHHILNPATGYPLDNELLSVTIISDNSIDCDIYSTLLYGMGVDDGIAYLRARPDIEAIFVTKNKQIILSSQRHFEFERLNAGYSLISGSRQER
ncbi:thiamine biosynthesis lipoprotein|uniref:FAD:protein FMN transferase n=1 Tax=Brenneria salicis ATCC 15712 = DSM 30166 TaxID=714314 RepID=A0A366I038_9GAMM|nr:FAD:protein FMN transferase [Brenneria salicis]NMN91854.1 thiamine biosynthesis lipoprotein [Brenneria salicis ATCC 15712 = DSM 30166]RBP59901.1 thiamine biosynthesis lipoprotein [Brenneria salicis ATCC 15712 = DSM 30166]RLM29856.1 thiamine biosynthesis protein ApbE [Brenneria salicis ATCC 15712 = DSM 30166]